MVTAQLNCTFVFVYEKTSVSHDAARLQIPHLRTVTTGKNSLTIKNGEEALPIMMDGKEDGIWVSELERSVSLLVQLEIVLTSPSILEPIEPHVYIEILRFTGV